MARSFNGTTDQILTSAYNMPTALTYSIWVKPNSPSSAYNGLIGQEFNASSTFQAIYLKSTNKVAYYVGNGGGFISVDPGTATLSNGVWSHLALTYDSSFNLKTYVGGVSDGTNVGATAANSSSIGLSLGYDASTASRNFPGSLADGAQWNVALTAGEILALSQGARPYQIRPASLLAYLPFDGLQSPEPDLSGNARNGTLTGTALASGPPVMQFTPRWPQFWFQPSAVAASLVFSQQTISIPILMTVPVTVTLHNP